VTITKEGKYFMDKKPIEEEGLLAEFKKAKSNSSDVSLVITADRLAYHGEVVHVIDMAKVQGITKFAINVERTR
jgi:biopolymer transport protein ExbD